MTGRTGPSEGHRVPGHHLPFPEEQGSHSKHGSAGCGALSAYVLGCMLAPTAALRLLFLFGTWLRGSGSIASVCGAGVGTTSARSNTAMKKPPVSVVSGEARRQCSDPGKVLRPR